MYTEEFLKRIKAFGVLQYNIDRIISITNFEYPEQLKADLKDPESIVCTMYEAGFNSGQYRLDAEAFKLAEIETQKAKKEFEDYDESIKLRKKLFGV
jgi:hypothetical protein